MRHMRWLLVPVNLVAEHSSTHVPWASTTKHYHILRKLGLKLIYGVFPDQRLPVGRGSTMRVLPPEAVLAGR